MSVLCPLAAAVNNDLRVSGSRFCFSRSWLIKFAKVVSKLLLPTAAQYPSGVGVLVAISMVAVGLRINNVEVGVGDEVSAGV